ncbi:hypothetical protein [Aminivibrio sp.]|uniref:DUF6935 domain-containing protein n=1 Tax=Aminivibrio sp. TaxID=1872489 RepID=UPI00345F01E6
MRKTLSSMGRTIARNLTVIAVVLTIAASPALAALPKNYGEFKARYAQEGQTPEGAAKLYFDAVFCYINPDTRAEGSKMLRYSLRLRQGWESSPNNRTFVERMEDPDREYLFRSYAVGATPQNNYAMDRNNYRLDIIKRWSGHSSGDLQLQLRNGGADNPRPILLRKFDGLWFVTNNSSTFVDVRRPAAMEDRTDHDADYDDVNYGGKKSK